MGRLAGPPDWRRVKPWKQRVAERRQEIERLRDLPPRPLVSPPGMRRRLVLLWEIGRSHPQGLWVGKRYSPPYTPDMRWLVERGFLRLSREPDISGRNRNLLRLAELGRRKIESYEPSAEDRRWIEAAFVHGVLG
jgi:hypothetical protein